MSVAISSSVFTPEMAGHGLVRRMMGWGYLSCSEKNFDGKFSRFYTIPDPGGQTDEHLDAVKFRHTA